jgi:hypothetical protein
MQFHPGSFSIDSGGRSGTLKSPSVVITILLENLGSGPAFDISRFQEDFLIRPQFAKTTIVNPSHLKYPNNDTCRKVKYDAAIGVIWPTGGHPTAIPDHRPEIPVDPAVQATTGMLGYHGCFSYMTAGKVHHTGFCSFLAPNKDRPMSEWKWVSCPGVRQNFAD